jgi:hypothetical protein
LVGCAGGWVGAGAGVVAWAPAQALRTIEAITSKAITIKTDFLFIFSSLLLKLIRSDNGGCSFDVVKIS